MPLLAPSARSFFVHRKKWQAKKEKAQAKGKKFTERPPVPPRAWNKAATLYGGMWKDRTSNSLVLKVWTGTCWSWLKCRLTGREQIRHRDESFAHLISRRIVQFAQKQGAGILVFEHLRKLKPEKGTYSRRGKSKRAFPISGRIFSYAKYKAWQEGNITSRVNPRNTSRECARCHVCLPHCEKHPVAATLHLSASRLRKRVRSCRARDARAQCHNVVL